MQADSAPSVPTTWHPAGGGAAVDAGALRHWPDGGRPLPVEVPPPDAAWWKRARAGMQFAWQGCRVLATRRALWPWTAGVWGVYLVVFATLAWLLLPGALRWWSQTWTAPDAWYLQIPWFLMAVAIGALALVVTLVATSVLASILASPLLDRISERIEDEWMPNDAGPFVLSVFVRDVLIGIRHTLLNLVVFGGVMGALFFVNLLPVLGSMVATSVGFVVSAGTLALEMSDYSLSRRRLAWRRKVGLLQRSRGLMLGFGAVGVLATSLPLVNIVMAPALVVGGTLLTLALQREGHLPVQDPVPDRAPMA